MRKIVTEVNPISARANAKLVRTGERLFLIGGMTADKVSCDIYEFKTFIQDENIKLEWKPIKFQNHVLTPRNSFSACGGDKKIYVWGGLRTEGMDQHPLSDLIEIDLESYKMRVLEVDKIPIHSCVLMYRAETNELVGYGGTDEKSERPCMLYTLDLNAEKLCWKVKQMASDKHPSHLWQHTAHLVNRSIFSGEEGNFLIAVGGCRHANSPYKTILEYDLDQGKLVHTIELKFGLVSHESIIVDGHLIIVGGATGGNFNHSIIILYKGELTEKEGHNSVGGVCCHTDEGLIVIGGVNGPMSINGIIAYPNILKQ